MTEGSIRYGADFPKDAFLKLVEEVTELSTGADSDLHGEHHWMAVGLAGARLLQTEDTADPLAVLLFALFHDSMRSNDGHDPEHGPRGALLAEQLLSEHVWVSGAQIDLVSEACHFHAAGRVSTDPTLGVCWDADRLNLWRVGTQPDPRYMSTSAGRDAATISWAGVLYRTTLAWQSFI